MSHGVAVSLDVLDDPDDPVARRPEPVADRILALLDVVAACEALRSLLRANNGGAADLRAVSVVNEAARRGGLELALDDDGAIGVTVSGKGVDAALARVVAVAFAAMLDGSWARLKACRQCTWVFWDTSKNRSGSWCSMQICGNRTKTREYRRRKAAGGRA